MGKPKNWRGRGWYGLTGKLGSRRLTHKRTFRTKAKAQKTLNVWKQKKSQGKLKGKFAKVSNPRIKRLYD